MKKEITAAMAHKIKPLQDEIKAEIKELRARVKARKKIDVLIVEEEPEVPSKPV